MPKGVYQRKKTRSKSKSKEMTTPNASNHDTNTPTVPTECENHLHYLVGRLESGLENLAARYGLPPFVITARLVDILSGKEGR